MIITASCDGLIKIWDKDFLHLKESLIYHNDWIWKLKIYSDLLVSCSDDKKVIIYELNKK